MRHELAVLLLARDGSALDPHLMTHLENCAECAAEYEDLHTVVCLLRLVTPEEPESGLPDGD
ncbi:hypothetical protein [Streptomyces zaomyceticus]|uniref:hypothetical protein n=1 Tax=Streptomyces zaomyceticus TaxID=68286 RepID=UPI00368297DE